MKKRILLTLAMSLLLVVILALSVSATQIGDLHYTLTESTDYEGFDGYAILSTDNQEITITDVVIPESVIFEEKTYVVTTISNNAFKGNKNITSIEIPSTVVTFKGDAFNGVSNLKKFNYTGTLEQWCKISTNYSNSVPLNYAKDIYFNNILLTELVIPEAVTEISSYCFYNCKSLTSIVMHENIKKINGYAFDGCTNITSLEYKGTLEQWYSSITFGSATSNPTYYVKDLEIDGEVVTDVVVPENITAITGYAFVNCQSLKSIELHDGVKSLGQGVFEGCTSITSIKIPDLVTSIPNSLFNGCTLLAEIDFPVKVTSIGKSAFKNCKSLPSIVILPDGVKTIDESAFQYCSSIKYIQFPTTLTKIGAAAFQDCSNLQFLDFGDNQNTFELPSWGVFMGCTSLKAVSLPVKLKSIPDRGFNGCTSLEAVYMPNTVTSIGTNYSGQGAFTYCENLYFVQEPFTVSQVYVDSEFPQPEKPDVYFLPTSLTGFGSKKGTEDIFMNCYSINKIVVFPEGFSNFHVAGVFRNCGRDEAKSIVFLGDMVNFKYDIEQSNITYYFVNESDLGLDDFTMVSRPTKNVGTNCKMIFCHSKAAYNLINVTSDVTVETAIELDENDVTWHVRAIVKVTPATCTEKEYTRYDCPCGVYIGTEETADAMGHLAGEIDSIKYTDGYLKIGYKYYLCDREDCTVESFTISDNAEYQVPAIFVNNGYSYSGTAILQGFAVNSDALVAYEEANQTTVQYGLVVGSVAKLGATNTLFDGTTLKAGAFSVSFDDKRNYSIFEMQVTGLTADYHNTELFVCAYVIDNGTVTYISNGANTSAVDPVTYNEVVANAEANQTTEIIIKKEENA
ncbi:MAG: leucine-rich repeat domain-containing protein [Clostridia bacterium]|nr:leucine-rich repeat domain-containing protein [Clostridia bacterium]